MNTTPLSPIELQAKRVWRIGEAAAYSGYAESYLYKLVMNRVIPGVSRPSGRVLHFDSEKFIGWLLSNPAKTAEEIEREASTRVCNAA